MQIRPTFADILSARQVIRPHVTRTPLRHYPSISAVVGAEVYLKHENYQVTGAFKVRGGLNLVSRLSEEERERGIISASTGNHGQSIAYAGRLFGVRAIIVVPEGANPGKVEAMQDLGAEVVFHGADFDESREHVERLCAEFGYRYVHSGNEPDLVAGVGTYGLEIMEDLPDVDTILVPIGGGSGACGTAIAAKAINPGVEVIGVGAAKAPAAYLSWKSGDMVEAAMETESRRARDPDGFRISPGHFAGHAGRLPAGERGGDKGSDSDAAGEGAHPGRGSRARRRWRGRCRSGTGYRARRWRWW